MKFNFINGNRRYTRVRSLFARTQCVQISGGQRNTYYPRLSAGLAYVGCPPLIEIAPTIEITRPRSRTPVRLLHRSIITYARQLGNGRGERGVKEGRKSEEEKGRGRERKERRDRDQSSRQTNPMVSGTIAATCLAFLSSARRARWRKPARSRFPSPPPRRRTQTS